ncbi:MAG: hypothetical protein ACR2PA_13880, partial [Hyphomicrobiaceae bacterium]
MLSQVCRILAAGIFGIGCLDLGAVTARAQDTKPRSAQLTPAEIAEREGRKACKIEICSAFRARKTGKDIACNITKSWRKEQLDKIVKKARVSWPWGPVICNSDINLKRADLIKAISEPAYELLLETHTVACE